MTRRGADRIAGHILGEKPPDATVRKPASRQSVYIVRPRGQSDAGGTVTRPITVRVDRT
uniref:Uncharacterized protein n=1 Tax=Panagrolaimus sp. ES5 TaxID=591445 RepID=A0AC34GKQ4_9BILA